ncbi:unnamed protein product [Lasius platythorax]|uniref:Uncharacterized protein n=1 Tax=Lasius platythorax TaxID=488582 RepID=A0AAV2NGH9_9HYME
MIKWINPLMI